MNEFTQKKIGEVAAFANVGRETLEKASEALEPILGDTLEESRSALQDMHGQLLALADREGAKDTVSAKCEKTGKKLRDMTNIYLTSDEDWNNPVEVFEWSSFFHGAGYAHSELILGAAETLEHDDLRELANASSKLHHDLLHAIVDFLKKNGSARARE